MPVPKYHRATLQSRGVGASAPRRRRDRLAASTRPQCGVDELTPRCFGSRFPGKFDFGTDADAVVAIREVDGAFDRPGAARVRLELVRLNIQAEAGARVLRGRVPMPDLSAGGRRAGRVALVTATSPRLDATAPRRRRDSPV